MWPFKRQTLLDPETAQWHVDNACWLLQTLGQTPMFNETRLVLPAPGFFDTAGANGHAMAEAIFQKVKAYAGMADWPVELVSDVETYESNTRQLIQPPSRPTPLGLFMRDHDGIVHISYAPKLLKKPVNLIATLAHELAHYVLHSIEAPLPCDQELEELLTDQTACMMGFGVFMANSAFEFEQYRDSGSGLQGWRSQRSGYLPEADLVFDTALFLAAKGLDASEAIKCLKPHLADQLKTAMKDMHQWRGDLETAVSNARKY